MADLHWFPWFPKDFLSSPAVQRMTLEQEGAYRRLLDLAWGEGRCEPCLPADDDALAAMSRLGKRWAGLGALIRAQFEQRDDMLYNPKLSAVWRESQERHNKAVERGSRGAAKRWSRDSQSIDSPSPEHSLGIRQALPEQWQSQSQTETTSPTSAREELLRLVPNRRAWELEFAAALQGMHGPRATDEQIDVACREYLGNGAAGKPNLPHWRGHLRRVVQPPSPMPKPNEGPDAGAYVQQIRDLIKQNPGRGNYLPKTEVAALGPDVLQAYESVGGADRFLALQAKDIPFLIRDFRAAYLRSAIPSGRDRAVKESD